MIKNNISIPLLTLALLFCIFFLKLFYLITFIKKIKVEKILNYSIFYLKYLKFTINSCLLKNSIGFLNLR